MIVNLPEAAMIVNVFFRDVGFYVDEKGTLYTRLGVPMGKSKTLFEFPEEYEVLNETVSNALKKHKIVRILTLKKVIQLAPNGEYRIYDIEKVKTWNF